jgi:DNA-binding protein Fis
MHEFQSTFILAVLRDSKGNQCRAAEKLGMWSRRASRKTSSPVFLVEMRGRALT